MSLIDWFQSSSSSSSPWILLMDGGVSTHLEELIRPNHFSSRRLWSSSLLLTPEGCETIVQGHKDWLLCSNVNIITTVTYQCHHHQHELGVGVVHTTTSPIIDHEHDDEGDDDGEPNDNSATSGTKRQNNVVDMGIPIKDVDTDEMLARGISLAYRAVREAKNDPGDGGSTVSNSRPINTFVVASTGPYGAAMADGSEYTGQYPVEVTRSKLQDFHRRKIQTILSNQPDGIAIETIPNLEEVGVICQVVKELVEMSAVKEQPTLVNDGNDQSEHSKALSNNQCCCWISLACRNEYELNDGNSVQDALDMIRSYDPDCQYIIAVGVNCFDSQYVSGLVSLLARDALRLNTTTAQSSTSKIQQQQQQRSPRGIVLYPNSGEIWDADHEDWKAGTGTTDTQFANRIMEAVEIVHQTWIDSNNNNNDENGVMQKPPKLVVGGCCRTNPETISLLRRRIDTWESKHNKAR